jgi:hypothetical protein
MDNSLQMMSLAEVRESGQMEAYLAETAKMKALSKVLLEELEAEGDFDTLESLYLFLDFVKKQTDQLSDEERAGAQLETLHANFELIADFVEVVEE